MNQAATPLRLGMEEWLTAAGVARRCAGFVPDVEEEQVADEAVSCYNCRYRRWGAEAITCLAILPNRFVPQDGG